MENFPVRKSKLAALLIATLLFSCTGQTSSKSKDGNPATGNNHSTDSKTSKKLNRLKNSTSPYLRQHADNPVDWYPWGPEALAKAKKENKPILLSIGYSACHWCHVMEHESFEDEKTAALMNKYFVNIKVDREERPDLDAIYMKAVTALTGSGGWPMTVFLTPDLKPFFAGTYFPKKPGYGHLSFGVVLNTIAMRWQKDKSLAEANATAILEKMKASQKIAAGEETDGIELCKESLAMMLAYSDGKWGGLGKAPKFPNPGVLELAMRSYSSKSGYSDKYKGHIWKFIDTTLNKMAAGGIYDQLGGGFSRYATDQKWMIPHYEKMLYDNAMLSSAYLNAYKIKANPQWSSVAKGTLDFVLQELTSSSKGYFYSSLDADSEGEEGKYYLFSKDELVQVLGKKEAKLASAYFGVTADGNFEDGKNVLFLAFAGKDNLKEKKKLLKELKVKEGQLKSRIRAIKEKLLQYRQKRVRPFRDEKMVTAWNGLMISSMVNGFSTLKEPKYLAAAKRCARFIQAEVQTEDGLLRLYSQDKAAVPGYLDDYAFMIQAYLDLASVDPDPIWFEQAAFLFEKMEEKFWDKKAGAYFYASNEHKDLILRTRMEMDGSTPAGTSIAAMNLQRMALLLNKPELKKKADQVLKYYQGGIERSPVKYAFLLCAYLYKHEPKSEIVISTDASTNTDNFNDLLFEIGQVYLPNSVQFSTNIKSAPAALRNSPLVKSKKTIQGKPTVYICREYSCRSPITSSKALQSALK